jgi:hypothetical protein
VGGLRRAAEGTPKESVEAGNVVDVQVREEEVVDLLYLDKRQSPEAAVAAIEQ